MNIPPDITIGVPRYYRNGGATNNGSDGARTYGSCNGCAPSGWTDTQSGSSRDSVVISADHCGINNLCGVPRNHETVILGKVSSVNSVKGCPRQPITTTYRTILRNIICSLRVKGRTTQQDRKS